MKTTLIDVGKFKAVRLPKKLVDQAKLDKELDVSLLDGCLIIRSAKNKPRKGWAKAFAEMARRGDDKLLDPPTPTKFDEEEWEW